MSTLDATADLIHLSDVPAVLPQCKGEAVHPRTVQRWANVGLRGVVLETKMVGGRVFTSQAMLAEFFARLERQRGRRRQVVEPVTARADAARVARRRAADERLRSRHGL